MPTAEEISQSKQVLYESASMRDDLNDEEATVLLKWGESQVERMAQDFPQDFEQKTRFLRQLIKNINRFVGQREFNEMEGQQQYMSKVTMYLPQLGWEAITQEQLFAAIPEDKTNMAGTLEAILSLLSPERKTVEPLENPMPHSITQASVEEETGASESYGEEETE